VAMILSMGALDTPVAGPLASPGRGGPRTCAGAARGWSPRRGRGPRAWPGRGACPRRRAASAPCPGRRPRGSRRRRR
jgi:hypothetical protein